ncbi:unnamed protein product [Parnassius apollo]|uniref:(apollo) hypothetical protein n=1 Tax=Parnassius apollo TaxID=110799 RepID=A0A8S3XNC8_PARAO|nr:unnamed protein product [Parnassius apollo]
MSALNTRGEVTVLWCATAAAMVLITITTVVGNLVVMAALWRVRRAPSHYPLASLVTADLFVGITVLPIAAGRELFVFHLDWTLCSFWSTMDVLCCTASILSLCVLGWERWCAITKPLARARRARHARLLAVLVWPVATLVAFPTVFIPSPYHHQPGELAKACTVNTNIIVALSFYVPAIIMIALYTCIVRALAAPPPIRAHRGRTPIPEAATTGQGQFLRCSTPAPCGTTLVPQRLSILLTPKGCHLNVPGGNNNVQSTPMKSTDAEDGIGARQRRATRTIVMLMSLFLICWTPFFVMLPVGETV